MRHAKQSVPVHTKRQQIGNWTSLICPEAFDRLVDRSILQIDLAAPPFLRLPDTTCHSGLSCLESDLQGPLPIKDPQRWAGLGQKPARVIYHCSLQRVLVHTPSPSTHQRRRKKTEVHSHTRRGVGKKKNIEKREPNVHPKAKELGKPDPLKEGEQTTA